MIAERRSQLFESQEKWRRCSLTGMSPVTTTTPGSLQKRLAALSSSADEWRKRVQRDDPPAVGRTKRPQINLLSKLQATNEDRSTVANPTSQQIPSKAVTLHSLDTGLKTFFSVPPPLHSSKEIDPSIALDLDVIEPTERLSTPRRPFNRPHRPGRKVIGTSERLKEIEVDNIHLEEDIRDHLEKIVVEDDLTSTVATSAKRGLESTEDYSAAKSFLKTADTVSPFPEVMLIRVKGEKKIDVRLVAPLSSSVHQSACFVLVTPKKLFLYHGAESNILEKTKATQICTNIVQKKDLFCSAEQLERVEGEAYSFFRYLEGDQPGEEPDLPLEPFELEVAKVNLILRVTDDYKLQSVVKGERPRFDILQSNETLILDFGSEIYVWSGRSARKTNARYAVEYAQQLMTKGVSCNECIFGCDMTQKRPQWTINRRVFQGVQDTLFASKFSDWQSSETKNLFKSLSPNKIEITPRRDPLKDASLLASYIRSLEHPIPKVLLEDVEFGRQTKDVITENTKFWILCGEQLEEIEATNILSTSQCYVVRWQYRIQVSGVRRLKDGSENDKETGRERVAYFYWLGKNTSPKMQGLCALKLSHMDKDKRPQIRVSNGEECSVFLELFGGKLIVKSDEDTAPPLYLIRGAVDSEGGAEQLDERTPLRSHAVYLQFDASTSPIIHAGAHCEGVHVKIALLLSNEIIAQGLCKKGEVIDRVQGDDSSLKWITVSGRKRTPRFYRLFDTDGEELISALWHPDGGVPFPHHNQSILRDTVLVDVGRALWIWSEAPPTTHVLRVAENFWNGRSGPSTVVEKGAEPIEFQAIFPSWSEWEVEEKENMVPSPVRPLDVCLSERLRTFSPQQLRERSELPAGMDLSRLETYLNEEDFQKVFQITRDSFDSLPQWKQIRLRKDKGLF